MPPFWITLGLAATLAAIAMIDARSFRIPDTLSVPLILAGLPVAWLWPQPVFSYHLIGGGIGYGSLALIGAWYFSRHAREGLGLGDAKLFAAAGVWLGWPSLPAVLLIAALGGLAHALWAKTHAPDHDGRIAFGPWLAAGFLLMWIIRWHAPSVGW